VENKRDHSDFLKFGKFPCGQNQFGVFFYMCPSLEREILKGLNSEESVLNQWFREQNNPVLNPLLYRF
jgi:hypothetical protein